jgi:ankyrin repeat protein
MGTTPVMIAIGTRDIAITQYLIESGADITIRNMSGMGIFEAAFFSSKKRALLVVTYDDIVRRNF